MVSIHKMTEDKYQLKSYSPSLTNFFEKVSRRLKDLSTHMEEIEVLKNMATKLLDNPTIGQLTDIEFITMTIKEYLKAKNFIEVEPSKYTLNINGTTYVFISKFDRLVLTNEILLKFERIEQHDRERRSAIRLIEQDRMPNFKPGSRQTDLAKLTYILIETDIAVSRLWKYLMSETPSSYGTPSESDFDHYLDRLNYEIHHGT